MNAPGAAPTRTPVPTPAPKPAAPTAVTTGAPAPGPAVPSQAARDARGYHLLSLDPLQGLYHEPGDSPGGPEWPVAVGPPPNFHCLRERDRIPLVVCITAYNEPWAHKPPRTGDFAASTNQVKESGTVRATLTGVVGNMAALRQVRLPPAPDPSSHCVVPRAPPSRFRSASTCACLSTCGARRHPCSSDTHRACSQSPSRRAYRRRSRLSRGGARRRGCLPRPRRAAARPRLARAACRPCFARRRPVALASRLHLRMRRETSPSPFKTARARPERLSSRPRSTRRRERALPAVVWCLCVANESLPRPVAASRSATTSRWSRSRI